MIGRLATMKRPGPSTPTLDQLQESLATIEENLARSRRQLAEAQQLSRIGSWEWDIVADEVWWSDELFRIYALEPGSVRPSYGTFLDYVHPDDRASVDARNRKAFADHEPFEDVKRVIRADGREIHMRTQGEVVCDDDGTPLRMVGVCEDVTARQLVGPGSELALRIEDEIVAPLSEAGVALARGELEEVADAIESARQRARQIAAGVVTPA
jgi:hypothetical protein